MSCMILRVIAVLFYICLIVLGLAVEQGRACTIWAAAGDVVDGGGTLLAKNRDNLSHLSTALRFYFPEKGYRSLGIYDVEADWYVVAGINERGLALTNASPNSISRVKRLVAKEDLTAKLLAQYESVDDLLRDTTIFSESHPAIYLAADSRKIASFEVAPGGMVAVSERIEGTLAFTNHYTGSGVVGANEKSIKSSENRLGIIRKMLSSCPEPFTLDHFIDFSNDGGSNGKGVWREGTQGSRIRTLAGWAVRIPQIGPAELYVKTVNYGEEGRVIRLVIDDTFWALHGNTRPIDE